LTEIKASEGVEMKKRVAKWVTWYMVIAMFLLGITPRVDAGFSPSELYNYSPAGRHADLQKIQKALESKMVIERLAALGFSPNEIQVKLDQLDDKQVHQMAQKIDELNVGGDGGEVLIAILLIAILVVLIIYLLGHKIVIK
jgi:Family of unknown function (DUF6627)